MEFDVLNVIFYLAVILIVTKFFGLAARHIGLPQVVGMVLAGLLIGPALFAQANLPFTGIISPNEAEMNALHAFAEVGVCLILFSSGLETNVKEMKQCGVKSTLVALGGVLVPLVLGTGGALLFMGGFSAAADPAVLFNALFVGCILTATSVGITIETLRELGQLNTPTGTVILSAAIIDDVLGILVLSLITGIQSGGSIWQTVLRAGGFFLFSAAFGYSLRALFRWLGNTRPHKRRTSIWAFGICFLFAYYAEVYFGIAAITGAYMAGLMLSGLTDSAFVDRKAMVSGYMIFTPIFFAYIGISADFSSFHAEDLLFCLVFVVLGVLGKILGCGGLARAAGIKGRESTSIGCGMVARGEVALAVYSSGAALIYRDSTGSLLGIDPLAATIFLILCTSVLCPVLLKWSFGGKKKQA